MTKSTSWMSKCRELITRARTPRSGNDSSVKEGGRIGPPEIPRGVVPDEVRLAMDSHCAGVYEYANIMGCREAFLGYPNLAQLTQKPEFRMLSEKTAQAMVRKWIEFKSSSTSDKSELIKGITEEMERLKVRELFEEMAKQDGFFGRAQLFVDLGEHDGPGLETPMIMDAALLFGKLRQFKVIEAMYSYPADYRADNPMADSYYNPKAWYIMGNKVHSSRLLLFIGRPLPNILKPAYNFGGMSMSQLAMPYVENWLSTRNSVNRMIKNFSITGIKTDMMAALNGDSGDDIITRGELYNTQRDSQGLFMLDQATEDMFQHNVPLTTLDALQAQSQEHMSSISSIPLIVLFGISPMGLNASSEGELQVWYDYIKDMQGSLFRENLKKVIEIIQISKYGKVDPELTFDFVSLWEPKPVEVETSRKAKADTAQIYFDMGVIAAEEVRDNLSKDPDSGWTGLPQIDLTALEDQRPKDDQENFNGTEENDTEADSPKPGDRS